MGIAMVISAPETAKMPASSSVKQDSSSDSGSFSKILDKTINNSSSSSEKPDTDAKTSDSTVKSEDSHKDTVSKDGKKDDTDKKDDTKSDNSDAAIAVVIASNQTISNTSDTSLIDDQNMCSVSAVDSDSSSNASANAVMAALADKSDVTDDSLEQLNAFVNDTIDAQKTKTDLKTEKNETSANQQSNAQELAEKDKLLQAQTVSQQTSAKTAEVSNVAADSAQTQAKGQTVTVSDDVSETAAKTDSNKENSGLVKNINSEKQQNSAEQRVNSIQTTQNSGNDANQTNSNNQSSQDSLLSSISTKVSTNAEKNKETKSSADFEVNLNTAASGISQKSTLDNVQNTKSAEKASSTIENADIQSNIINQVVKEVKLSQSEGKNTLVVRLDPPQLGSLKVQITQDTNGETNAQIQADTDQVRTLLQAHASAIADSLSNAGIKMDSVLVTSGASSGSFMQNSSGQSFDLNSGRQQYSGSNKQTFSNSNSSDVQSVSVLASGVQSSQENAGYSWLA